MEPIVLVIVFILLGILVAIGIWAYMTYFSKTTATTAPLSQEDTDENTTKCTKPETDVDTRNTNTDGYIKDKNGKCIISPSGCKTNYKTASDNKSCVMKTASELSAEVNCEDVFAFENTCLNKGEVGVTWKFFKLGTNYNSQCAAKINSYNVYAMPASLNLGNTGWSGYNGTNRQQVATTGIVNNTPLLFYTNINGSSTGVRMTSSTNSLRSTDVTLFVDPIDSDGIPVFRQPKAKYLYGRKESSQTSCDSQNVPKSTNWSVRNRGFTNAKEFFDPN
jgi:hypothetical protein